MSVVNILKKTFLKRFESKFYFLDCLLVSKICSRAYQLDFAFYFDFKMEQIFLKLSFCLHNLIFFRIKELLHSRSSGSKNDFRRTLCKFPTSECLSEPLCLCDLNHNHQTDYFCVFFILQNEFLGHSLKKQKDSLETQVVLLIFSLGLEISEVAVQSIHQNSEKW